MDDRLGRIDITVGEMSGWTLECHLRGKTCVSCWISADLRPAVSTSSQMLPDGQQRTSPTCTCKPCTPRKRTIYDTLQCAMHAHYPE
jgi:hypothetical protein